MDPIKVKVVINDGIVTGVLANGDVDVEIIDINEDYGDFDGLKEYEAEVYNDPSMKEQDFTMAHFREDDE